MSYESVWGSAYYLRGNITNSCDIASVQSHHICNVIINRNAKSTLLNGFDEKIFDISKQVKKIYIHDFDIFNSFTKDAFKCDGYDDTI